MKYHEELDAFNTGDPSRRGKGEIQSLNIEGDPALEFNPEFLAQWQSTANYALFKRLTSDALLFSIVEPRHPCAGGLNIEDIQRRLSQQVADLHLDDRVREGREVLNRHLATGQKKVSAAFNSFWADIESMREAQRKKNEEKAIQSQRSSMDQGRPSSPTTDSASVTSTGGASSWFGVRRAPSFDITQAQASASTVGQRAGAYISSWGTWASEKRKEWQEKKNSPTSSANVTSPSTPTLDSISEIKESDRGRRRSLQLHSGDSGGLSRSVSRRKRLSNILLRRESGEFGSPSRKHGSSSEGSEIDTPYPRSPLAREAPISDADSFRLPSTASTDTTDSTGNKHEAPAPSIADSDPKHSEPRQVKDVQPDSTIEGEESPSELPTSSAEGHP